MSRVLLVGTGTLLDETLIGLLVEVPELQVSTLVYRDDAELISLIIQYQSEVIVLTALNQLPVTKIIEAIIIHNNFSPIRIIVVDPESNALRICDRITVTRSEDLFQLLRQASSLAPHAAPPQ